MTEKDVNFELHGVQREVLEAWQEGYKRIVIAAGRQSGKTYLALLICLIELISGEDRRVFWVSKTNGQAREALITLQGILNDKGIPDDFYKVRTAPDTYVEFANGGRFDLKSAERPDNIRGPAGINGLVLDEAAFASEEIWTTLRPVLGTAKGWALLISSPNKMDDWFHEEFKKGREGTPDYNPDYASFHMTTYDNPWYPDSLIEMDKRSMSVSDFSREFLAEFVSGKDSKLDESHIQAAIVRDKEIFAVHEDGEPNWRIPEVSIDDLDRYIGCDIGIKKSDNSDWSCLVHLGIHRESGRVYILNVHRFKAELYERIDVINQKYHEWEQPINICIEDVGMQYDFITKLETEYFLPIVKEKPKGSKEQRFNYILPKFQRGQVWIVRANCGDEYIRELLKFSGEGSPNDDQIDATSYAMICAAKRTRKRPPKGLAMHI